MKELLEDVIEYIKKTEDLVNVNPHTSKTKFSEVLINRIEKKIALISINEDKFKDILKEINPKNKILEVREPKPPVINISIEKLVGSINFHEQTPPFTSIVDCSKAENQSLTDNITEVILKAMAKSDIKNS